MNDEPLYCAEQIKVPPELADLLKCYVKEVIRHQPPDLISFSAQYFADLCKAESKNTVIVPPNLDQVTRLYRALKDRDFHLSQGNASADEIEALIGCAVDAGISRQTVEEVLRIAEEGGSASVEHAELCLLLLTTCSSDDTSLIQGMLSVFGDSGALDAALCRHLFATLARYDARWNADVLAHIDEQVGAADKVGYSTLMALLDAPGP